MGYCVLAGPSVLPTPQPERKQEVLPETHHVNSMLGTRDFRGRELCLAAYSLSGRWPPI